MMAGQNFIIKEEFEAKTEAEEPKAAKYDKADETGYEWWTRMFETGKTILLYQQVKKDGVMPDRDAETELIELYISFANAFFKSALPAGIATRLYEQTVQIANEMTSIIDGSIKEILWRFVFYHGTIEEVRRVVTEIGGYFVGVCTCGCGNPIVVSEDLREELGEFQGELELVNPAHLLPDAGYFLALTERVITRVKRVRSGRGIETAIVQLDTAMEEFAPQIHARIGIRIDSEHREHILRKVAEAFCLTTARWTPTQIGFMLSHMEVDELKEILRDISEDWGVFVAPGEEYGIKVEMRGADALKVFIGIARMATIASFIREAREIYGLILD